MSDKPATRKDIDDVLNVLKGFVQQTGEQFVSMDEKFEKIDGRFKGIDERFDKIDDRFDKFAFNIDARFNKIELEIIDLKKTLDNLMIALDKFVGRIDDYETEQTARDSQFEKLLAWAHKVSAKTGIPLENL